MFEEQRKMEKERFKVPSSSSSLSLANPDAAPSNLQPTLGKEKLELVVPVDHARSGIDATSNPTIEITQNPIEKQKSPERKTSEDEHSDVAPLAKRAKTDETVLSSTQLLP